MFGAFSMTKKNVSLLQIQSKMQAIQGHDGYLVNKLGEVARRLRSQFRKHELKKLRPFYGKKGGGGVVTLYDKGTGKRTYRKVA